MKKREILITQHELIDVIGEKEYTRFIDVFVKKINEHEDYENLNKDDVLFLKFEW